MELSKLEGIKKIIETKKTKFIVLILGFVLFNPMVFADPLMLSPAEMQKLQQYFPDQESEGHFIWQGNPITLNLPLNQEKRLVFPQSVTPDLKGALTTDQLHIINNHGSLYLTALKPFSKVRMFATLADTNDVVMLDLSTDAKADNAIAYIDLAKQKSSTVDAANQTNDGVIQTSAVNNTNNLNNMNNEDAASNLEDNPHLSGNDTDVTLIRFAWQSLFAPDRLLSNPYNITRTPMHTSSFISDLVYGDKVIAHPLVSWQMNETYVTAVELRNKYPHYTSINPARDLCGHWQAVSLYPNRTLKPAGENNKNKNGDSTVLFLISSKPFGNSLEVCHGLS